MVEEKAYTAHKRNFLYTFKIELPELSLFVIHLSGEQTCTIKLLQIHRCPPVKNNVLIIMGTFYFHAEYNIIHGAHSTISD